MEKEKYRDEFENYIDELRNMYEEKPGVAIREVRNSAKRIRSVIENKNRPILNDKDFDKFAACVLVLVIALVGLLNIENYLIYLFGLAFFCGGYFVGTNVPKFGLIFLFSHGLTGMCIMIGSVIKPAIDNPAFYDDATGIYIYMGIGILLILISFIGVVLYNLSDVIKERRHSLVTPLALFFIVFLMSGLLPKIFNFLYSLHI